MAGDTQEQRETLAEWLAKINPLQWLLTLQTLIGSSEFVPTLQVPSPCNGFRYRWQSRITKRYSLCRTHAGRQAGASVARRQASGSKSGDDSFASTKPLQWLLTQYHKTPLMQRWFARRLRDPVKRQRRFSREAPRNQTIH